VIFRFQHYIQVDPNVLEEPDVTIFRVKFILILKLEAADSSETLVPTYKITWCHFPADTNNSYSLTDSNFIYCDVLPVNTSNNSWVVDFVSQFIGSSSSGITLADYTSNLNSHKPVTCSGSYSWGTAVSNSCNKLLRRNSYDKLLSQTALIINPSGFYNLSDPLLVCSLPR
jgi:hypothetical protein